MSDFPPPPMVNIGSLQSESLGTM